jgi:hypothetical protein
MYLRCRTSSCMQITLQIINSVNYAQKIKQIVHNGRVDFLVKQIVHNGRVDFLVKQIVHNGRVDSSRTLNFSLYLIAVVLIYRNIPVLSIFNFPCKLTFNNNI